MNGITFRPTKEENMHHIDEHTIELYVLGSDLVKEQIAEIEAHLKECRGCRTLAGQMEAFYKNAEDSLQISKNYVKNGTQKSKALVRINKAVEQYYDPFAPPVRYHTNTPLAKMFYFVRRHPVAVSISSFASFIVVGWLLNDFIKPVAKDNAITDKNPSSFLYNTNANMLEIYNKQDEKLWEIISPGLLERFNHDRLVKRSSTVLCDIDNNDTNEVITNISLRKEGEHSLKILNAYKKIILEKEFVVPFNYLNRTYSPNFSPDGIVVNNFKNKEKKEIILITENIGRSPAFVARLDEKGNEIGRYWHFGYFMSMFPLDVNNDGKEELVLCGKNDTPDSINQEYPVIAVIDPLKIIGDTKSTACPGFNWKFSDAELFYIRFPRSDINDQLKCIPQVNSMNVESESDISFFSPISGDYAEQDLGFDFYFSKNLKIRRVKSNSAIIRFRANMVNKGKLAGEIDQPYLDNLKNNIRYWDGKKWRKEWTMVKH
ncbi:MAG: hypothetical protein C0417_04495 [Chlorobiaceae bacterium]|nr:hypothetical protein [Chlorobiaceae bacterium]